MITLQDIYIYQMFFLSLRLHSHFLIVLDVELTDFDEVHFINIFILECFECSKRSLPGQVSQIYYFIFSL